MITSTLITTLQRPKQEALSKWCQNTDPWLDRKCLHPSREVGQRYLLMQFQIPPLHGGDYIKPRL